MHIDPILSEGDTEKYKEYELINKRKQRVKTMTCWDSDSAYQNVHVRRMSEGEAAVARRTERSTFESAVSSDRGNFYPPPFPEYLTQKPRPFLAARMYEIRSVDSHPDASTTAENCPDFSENAISYLASRAQGPHEMIQNFHNYIF